MNIHNGQETDVGSDYDDNASGTTQSSKKNCFKE
jgi:hypothetical protein